MRYGRMFQYLFRLKRMQLELDRTWAVMSSRKDSGQALAHRTPPGAIPLWQVRSHMAHFINNLQLYIQVLCLCNTSHTPKSHCGWIRS